MRLDSLYSLLAKFFDLTLPNDGWFTIILYSQTVTTSDLLHLLALLTNITTYVCLAMAEIYIQTGG